MTTQWGAPLTGAQMKLLRAAGLGGGTKVMFLGAPFHAGGCSFNESEPYHLPADHIAYTLLEAGWLDGRNVALWFGGEKAPDDWLEGSDVLFRSGEVPPPLKSWTWRHLGVDGDIIAYARKIDVTETPVDDNQSNLMAADDKQTVTIAKMTEAEANEWLQKRHCAAGGMNLLLLDKLGLIKPEQTRLERFWRSKCRERELWEDIVKEALEFEQG